MQKKKLNPCQVHGVQISQICGWSRLLQVTQMEVAVSGNAKQKISHLNYADEIDAAIDFKTRPVHVQNSTHVSIKPISI